MICPKMVVLCMNSAGAAEFHSCAPEVSQEQHEQGEHYERAKENAEMNGYGPPMIAFDASDPAAKQLLELAEWVGEPVGEPVEQSVQTPGAGG